MHNVEWLHALREELNKHKPLSLLKMSGATHLPTNRADPVAGQKKRFDLTAKTCGSCREIAPQFLHTFHLEQQL